MAENTKIQWCHHTFNPWIGCSKVNEGCKFCYAEELMANRYGRVEWGPDGTRSRTKTWRDPLRWQREAAAAGETRKVFCASLADVFEDRPDLVPWREELFELIDQCPSLNFLLLTKRPENIFRMWPQTFPQLRENVWLGTSIANQRNADEFIPRLLKVRSLAPVLFVSLEPQIDAVDLTRLRFKDASGTLNCLTGQYRLKCKGVDGYPDFTAETVEEKLPHVDWVIVGGESKQGHGEPRPFDLRWARQTRDACENAGVPFFLKQVGSRPYDSFYRTDQRVRFKDSHGGDMAEWPEDLRLRQCPENYVELVA